MLIILLKVIEENTGVEYFVTCVEWINFTTSIKRESIDNFFLNCLSNFNSKCLTSVLIDAF